MAVLVVDKILQLMLESALLALRESQSPLGSLVNYPALYPFQLPMVSDDFISHHSKRSEVVRYGLDDVNLSLKRQAR